MLSLTSTRTIASIAALAFAALGVASSAHARTDVTVSIGVQLPGAYVYAEPIYAPPPRVFVQPRPVYVQPHPIYVQPAPVFVRPQPVVIYPPAAGHGYRPAPHWNHGQWKKHHRHGFQGHRRDRD